MKAEKYLVAGNIDGPDFDSGSAAASVDQNGDFVTSPDRKVWHARKNCFKTLKKALKKLLKHLEL